MKTKDWLYQNTIKISQWHKDNCRDQECECSLWGLALLLTMAGIEIKNEDIEVFL